MSGPKRNGNSNGNGKPRKRSPQGTPASARAGRNIALARATAGSSARYTTTKKSAGTALDNTHTHTHNHDALLTVAPDELPEERLTNGAPGSTDTAGSILSDPPAPPEASIESEDISTDDIAEYDDNPLDDMSDDAEVFTTDSRDKDTDSSWPSRFVGASAGRLLASRAAAPFAPPEPPTAEKSFVERSRRFNVDLSDLGPRSQRLAIATWDRLRSYSLEQYLWFGVLLLAAILRFWDLGGKPLHHDESMHAYFSLAFANDPASYAYNPLLHGPFQFHAEGIVFAVIMGLEHLFGQAQAWGNPWINDATARIVPASFGVGIVALPIWLRRELSRPGALFAAFLLAVSPAFVYFSRFLREDIYFNFFMFLMVVAAVRYASARSLKWFVTLFAATVLAYATFEGTYLTLVIFGSFLAVLLIWELAHSVAKLLPPTLTARERAFFSRAGLLVLAAGLGAIVAHFGLQELNAISTYVNSSQAAQTKSDAFVQRLENQTVAVILYASIAIALLVIGALFWQMYRDDAAYAAQLTRIPPADPDNPFDEGFLLEDPDVPLPLSRVERLDRVFTAPGRAKSSLRERLDPNAQPFLRLLLGISWVQWFVAFVAGWMLFAALYWVLPGDGHSLGQGFQQGIGQGVWQGIYYWIQQQNVARGGQPWYYYLMLLPLYEQLACVFGITGIVYALIRPTRFRLFLVWWFALSMFLYSWAGEKMPWLSIHILLPLMLLSGIALAAVLRGCVALVRQLAASESLSTAGLAQWLRKREASWVLISAVCVLLFVIAEIAIGWSLPLTLLVALSLAVLVTALVRAGIFRPTAAVLGATAALLLLIPMIHSMLVLTYQDPANGPHEMMVYVQTTPDVDLVMQKIQQADQALYGGKHEIRIGVGTGQEWPFYWYLKDYPNTIFGYPASNPNAPKVDVLILSTAADGVGTPDTSDAFMALHPQDYTAKEYALRSWWDEGYKLPYCTTTTTKACTTSANWGTGVGPGLYLTYGDNPKPHAQFNFGIAAGRVWSWLWTRQPFGNATGPYYDFVFVVRNGVPIHP